MVFQTRGKNPIGYNATAIDWICRGWKIEGLFACLENFLRWAIRYEGYGENFLGMFHLGCCVILLRHYEMASVPVQA
jgi:hypothetical protein